MTSDIILRLRDLDRLIIKRNTGSPEDLARRFRVSERSVRKYVSMLKELGAPVHYCKKAKSYIYSQRGGFSFKFEPSIPND